MRHEEWIADELRSLRRSGLDRRLAVRAAAGGKIRAGGRTLINFTSNDYLDLAHHPAVVAAASQTLDSMGAGAGASRLVSGTMPVHVELEAELARYKGCPAALVFGSGYLANVGVITSLVGRDDSVFVDRLVHASILDAAVMSRAKLRRFRHNDAGHLEELLREAGTAGKRLVVTESLFSMDGDIAPLRDLAEAAGKHGAMLMVDEAHATGVLGPSGAGLARELGLEKKVNVSMGTLSKAFGGYGGFVACSAAMRELLINKARAFIFSTALPPASAAAARAALRVVRERCNMGERLLENAAHFRRRLSAAGLDTGGSESQIVPVIVGGNRKAVAFSKRLLALGILAPAIRPPTVPEGTSRLRLSVTLAHSREELTAAASVIARVARELGVI